MSITKEEELSLQNLGDGAAIEMFNEELQSVLNNIVDPNTNPKQSREVILKVKITPDEDRQIGTVSVQCKPNLAPAREFLTTCIIGRLGKKGEAREIKAAQTTIFDDQGKVTPIDQGKE